jgi:hypothetical protein
MQIKNHYENLRSDHARLEIVVAALPDAIRTMTATLMTLRETVSNISGDIKSSVQSSLTSFASEVRSFINNTVETLKKQRPTR